MTFSLRPQAQQDLAQLLEHIALDNIDAAYRVRDAIMHTFKTLSENPLIGKEITDLSIKDVRRFPVSGFNNYSIFYRITDQTIEIIRLGYGDRDWGNILK